MDIRSYHGMKVKLKLFMHSEYYYLIDYSLYIVKLCSCSFFPVIHNFLKSVMSFYLILYQQFIQ